MIYLDHAATTPMVPEAWEAMRPFATEHFGNPASAHAVGRKARQALEDARERIAKSLHSKPDEIIFTSGATEANNLALHGLSGSPPGHLLSSDIEHPCIVEPLKQLAGRDFEVECVAVEAFRDRVRPDTRLGMMMLVNHETGSIQPVRECASRVPLHCDAAQAVGKIPVSFRNLGVMSMSVSGHKFGGPKGIGALIVRHGTKLAPQLCGGHQQQGRRPGTEPVALAVGMATALEMAVSQLENARICQQTLRDLFLGRLREMVNLVVNSPDAGSPYIANVSFPGCRAEVLLMKLDLAGIACSTGSACSSGSLLPSPVLQALGVPDEVLRSAMRFSFGFTTTEEEVMTATERIAKCVRDLRNVN